MEPRAAAVATIEGLIAIGLPPTPTNYAVWYAHVSGDNPALSRGLAERMATGEPLTSEILEALWRQYCAPGGDPVLINEASEKLGRVMARLGEQIASAGGSTGEFAGALSRFGQEIVAGLSSPDIASVMRDATRRMLIETRRIAESNRSLEGTLEAAGGEVATLRSDLDDLRRQSLTDPLTGVGNRQALEARLAELVERARLTGEPFSVIAFDIDHFRRFNEAYGPILGDEALKAVAQTLVDGVKGRDLVVRFGGEEFVLVLPNTVLAGAVRLALVLATTVKSRRVTIRSSGRDLGRITLSGGVVTHRPSEDASAVLTRATSLLLAAKRDGRDMIRDETSLSSGAAGGDQ